MLGGWVKGAVRGAIRLGDRPGSSNCAEVLPLEIKPGKFGRHVAQFEDIPIGPIYTRAFDMINLHFDVLHWRRYQVPLFRRSVTGRLDRTSVTLVYVPAWAQLEVGGAKMTVT